MGVCGRCRKRCVGVGKATQSVAKCWFMFGHLVSRATGVWRVIRPEWRADTMWWTLRWEPKVPLETGLGHMVEDFRARVRAPLASTPSDRPPVSIPPGPPIRPLYASRIPASTMCLSPLPLRPLKFESSSFLGLAVSDSRQRKFLFAGGCASVGPLCHCVTMRYRCWARRASARRRALRRASVPPRSEGDTLTDGEPSHPP